MIFLDTANFELFEFEFEEFRKRYSLQLSFQVMAGIFGGGMPHESDMSPLEIMSKTIKVMEKYGFCFVGFL